VELLAALEGSALASVLRQSFWLYPLVNTGHVLGVALLFGGIVPMDARLLGLWRAIPIAALARVLLPFVMAGCALAVATGGLLFIVQPTEYAAKPIFWIKMGLVLLGIANALVLRRTVAWRAARRGAVEGAPAARLRLAGGLSLGAWLTALVLGRLLGYL